MRIDTDSGTLIQDIPAGTTAGPVNSLSAQKPQILVGSLQPPLPTSSPTAGQGLSLDATGNVPLGVTVSSVTMLSADPASPINGQYWYRTDTDQWCVRNGATTKRSAAFT
jgi:hypothetical protein